MIDVSIIIINYNTIKLLVDVLDSIFERCSGFVYEVIVVDNNSSDNSVDICLERYGDRVVFLSLKENIGFGRANNEGIRLAQGRNVFLLNPDTVLLNNGIKILSDFLDRNLNVAVCGGNLYTKEGKPTHSYEMYLPALYSEIDQLLGKLLSKLRYGENVFFNNTGNPLKVGYITGADMMIRKSVLDQVGFFDPKFFMYFEETELTYRIRNAGYDIMSIPEAKIIHLEGQSHKLKESREEMFLSSRRLYLKMTLKYKISYPVCQLIYGIYIFIRVMYYSLFLRNVDYLKIWKYRLWHF